MIQIVDLVKTYGKGADSLVALNHISLTLPDKGLVFILGKSGCGKSTLLNMLGGLDDITSGEIIYDGLSISKLSENELNNYRNNYVGIIYQNFNLFEKDSVFENVYIAGKKDDKNILTEKIDNMLKELSLEEKKHTQIKNLSGGQKQRVAIARALIKDSKVILADEPTGNLDSKNTKMIFDILQDAAKDRLVIVVSHDIKSAETYADRIIYLSDGTILDDVTRNTDFEETGNYVLEVPADCELTEEKLEEINVGLEKEKLELRKNKKKFYPTNTEGLEPETKADVKNRVKNISTPLRVSFKFLSSTYVSFIMSIILLSVIIALLAFSNTLMMFDESDAIKVLNEKYDAKAYVLTKAYSYYDDPLNVTKSNIYEIKENDIQAFKNNGYTGNAFPVYNVSLVNYSYTDAYKTSDKDLYSNFYAKGGLGVAVVTTEYLEKTFGGIEILAGSLYGLENDDRIIITDYLADSLIMNCKLSLETEYISDDPNDPYQKLVNTMIHARFKVGAIIKTNYKEKYESLIELYNQLFQDPQHKDEIRKQIKEHSMINNFDMDVNTILNYGYSINPNYEQAILDRPDDYYFLYAESHIINDKADEFYAQGTASKFYSKRTSADLSPGEMCMALPTYNTLFGKSVKSDKAGFEQEELILKFHKFDEKTGADAFFSLPIKIVDVYDTSDKNQCGRLSYEDFRTLKDAYLFPYELLFDDPYQCYALNNASKDLYYYSNLSVYSPVFTVCNIIEVFSSIFKFLFIALIGVAAIVLLMHHLRVIKKSRYLIGVYKSMGYPSYFFTGVAVLDSLYLNLGIFGFSLLFSYLTTTLINRLLTSSFAKFFNEPLITSMKLISFSFVDVAIYVGIVFAVSIATFLASIIAIRRLKPNNILHKAVE